MKSPRRLTGLCLLLLAVPAFAAWGSPMQAQANGPSPNSTPDPISGPVSGSTPGAALPPLAPSTIPPAEHAFSRAARLTFLAGSVQVQRADSTGEDTPVLNMPLNEGTRIITGDYGEAEIEFEDGSVARLTPRSSLALDTLTLNSSGVAGTEISLLGGLAYFELRKAVGYPYLVNAGVAELTPIENATIRIALDGGPALFAVLTGSVEVERRGGFQTEVRAGESLHADPKDQNRYFLTSEIKEDSWDHWNESRDQVALDDGDKRTRARDSYAGAQGYGWSDLDANGSWYDIPGEGEIWQPSIAGAGFDPYGYGNWVWANSGYVWASGYPWGWTPYRCGQWNYFSGFGWGWGPNASCGGWGYGGANAGGFVVIGSVPKRYAPVRVPIAGPGKVHPIVAVHQPEGARPPSLHGGPVKIAGTMAMPIARVGSTSSRSTSAVGETLNRDFPVNPRTHQPVLGTSSPGARTISPSASGYVSPQAAPAQALPYHGVAGPAVPGAGSVRGTNAEGRRTDGVRGRILVSPPAGNTPSGSAPHPVNAPPAPAKSAPSAPTMAAPAPRTISPPPMTAPSPRMAPPPPPPPPPQQHISPPSQPSRSEPAPSSRPKP